MRLPQLHHPILIARRVYDLVSADIPNEHGQSPGDSVSDTSNQPNGPFISWLRTRSPEPVISQIKLVRLWQTLEIRSICVSPVSASSVRCRTPCVEPDNVQGTIGRGRGRGGSSNPVIWLALTHILSRAPRCHSEQSSRSIPPALPSRAERQKSKSHMDNR